MNYENYRQLDADVDKLFAEKKYAQAIVLLEIARQHFPEFIDEILWYQAIIYVLSGRHDHCLTTLEEIISKGLFNQLEWDVLDPVRDNARFKTVFEANQRLLAEAQKNARMQYRIFTPDGYNPQMQYPLFIALHGNGDSLDYFIYNWEPAGLLNKGFIVCYVQSSQTQSNKGFSWTVSYETTRRDIKAAYDAVVQQYAVDPHNILVGGFSGGAIAAIEVAMANTLTLKGFVSLCPDRKPDSFSRENVRLAAQRGVRGVILEGENEGTVPAEQEMLEVFNVANLPCQFVLNPNTGHAFPPDFDQKLLDAIEFIKA